MLNLDNRSLSIYFSPKLYQGQGIVCFNDGLRNRRRTFREDLGLAHAGRRLLRSNSKIAESQGAGENPVRIALLGGLKNIGLTTMNRAVAIDKLYAESSSKDLSALIDELLAESKNLMNLAGLIKTSRPVKIPVELQEPEFRFIKVGISTSELEEGARRTEKTKGYILSLGPKDFEYAAKYIVNQSKRKQNSSHIELLEEAEFYIRKPNGDFEELFQKRLIYDQINNAKELTKKMKVPREAGWQKPDKQYAYNDHSLLTWLENHSGYGVVAGPGGLRMLDADNYELISQLLEWPITLQVKTGRKDGNGCHTYFVSDDIEDELSRQERLKARYPFIYDGKELGELKIKNTQCVGPGSWHPSGNRYEVIP